MVNELEYGQGFHCSRKRTHHATDKDGNDETKDIIKTSTIDGKLKRPVVKLAPMFYENVFREKNRTGNVGDSH